MGEEAGMAIYDLVVIGGGINGTAIARDAAGRGLSVLLAEQQDLGAGTSWASSKLIHGGLRYLEQGALALVHEGLMERARLLRTAPHIIWPARFVLPHHKGLRPAWMLRLGLFLYDCLGGNHLLPGACSLDLRQDAAGTPLKPLFTKAFEYSDCAVDDARLVVLNAVDATEKGATIRTHTRFVGAERRGNLWRITLEQGGGQETVEARALVSAAGPWIEKVGSLMPPEVARAAVTLIKGSHIVVRRLFDHDKSYIFQNSDGRIVFALPFAGAFTMIGTTDVPFTGDPATVAASEEEIAYLCALANEYFAKPVMPADVVWHFSGIRALYDNRTLKAKDLSRDYFLALDAPEGHAPLLSVYGGKLTAARHLAEVALKKLAPFFPPSRPWTGAAPLPGGDFPWQEFDARVEALRAAYPFLDAAHAKRLCRAYGTRAHRVLGSAHSLADLGAFIGADLYEAEIRYLMRHEWARHSDDILWRRSKLGLVLDAAEQKKLAAFMAGEARHD